MQHHELKQDSNKTLERPVATQHSLRTCVDHLAALSHVYATTRVETRQ